VARQQLINRLPRQSNTFIQIFQILKQSGKFASDGVKTLPWMLPGLVIFVSSGIKQKQR